LFSARTGANPVTQPVDLRLQGDTFVQLEQITLEVGDDIDEKAVCTVHAMHHKVSGANVNDLTCIQLDLALQATQDESRFTKVVFNASLYDPGR
jgi:hypothetical protein